MIASTVEALGVASTATRSAPPTRSATEVAAPIRSLRLNVTGPICTALPTSSAAGFNEVSSTAARLPGTDGCSPAQHNRLILSKRLCMIDLVRRYS